MSQSTGDYPHKTKDFPWKSPKQHLIGSPLSLTKTQKRPNLRVKENRFPLINDQRYLLQFQFLIIRRIDLTSIAIANIRLELLYSTILFLSRESLRRYVPKRDEIHSIGHYINLIWLILPLGFLFIFVSLFFTLFISINHTEQCFPDYNRACLMYALAAFIQLLSEPLHLLAKLTGNERINIFIEFIASILGFSLQTVLILLHPQSALFYYAVGSIIYSMFISSFYLIYFWKKTIEDRRRLFVIQSFSDLLIRPTAPFLDDRHLDQTWTALKRELSSRIVTHGEKYLLTLFFFISYEEQAIYSIIYLLGSTFPQVIFSTIEQISWNYFRATFSIITDRTSSLTSNEQRTLIFNALTLLEKLIRLFTLISLLLIIFIIPHSSSIMTIYFGEILSTKFPLVFYLRLYLLKIFLSGINVFYQSFLQSIMSNVQCNSYEDCLFIYSLIYFIGCLIFIYLFGIGGILLSNSLNIFGRILLNHYFIKRYFTQVNWLKSYLLSSHYVFLLLTSLILFYFNRSFIDNFYGQWVFASGWSLTIICLSFIEEREVIHYLSCVYQLNFRI